MYVSNHYYEIEKTATLLLIPNISSMKEELRQEIMKVKVKVNFCKLDWKYSKLELKKIGLLFMLTMM